MSFLKFNQFLLTNFVCLYSKEIGLGLPSVTPSSAGLNLASQLIKSLGSSVRHHGKRAQRPKATNALGNTFSGILGATPVQDQKE